MEKGKEFYEDLDEVRNHREKKSSCSCLSLVVFFIALLLVLELSLYFVSRGLRSKSEDQGFVSPQGQLEMKGSGVDIGADRFALSVSQGMLCSALSESADIQDLSCAISSDGILLTGKLGSFLPSNAKAVIVPEAKSGRVVFKIKKVSVGIVRVPAFLSGRLEDTLNLALYKTFPDLEKAEVDKVELQEAVMTITAKKR